MFESDILGQEVNSGVKVKYTPKKPVVLKGMEIILALVEANGESLSCGYLRSAFIKGCNGQIGVFHTHLNAIERSGVIKKITGPRKKNGSGGYVSKIYYELTEQGWRLARKHKLFIEKPGRPD